MKNKKGETIYSEEIFFLAKFRVRRGMAMPEDIQGYPETGRWMPIIMTGWVEGECHLQWGYQSLQ